MREDEGIFHSISPLLLDTEKRNLRSRFKDELSKRHRGAILATLFALKSHGSLHLIGEVSQPVLNVSFSHNGIKKLNIFSESSEFHVDFVNVRAFVFVESYGGDTSEKFLEIVLELLGVRSHRENLEEIVHGTEVESREESTLTIEISIKLLLAMLEFRLESTELRGKNIVGAANDNVRAFVSTLHNLLPGFVDFTESGCVLRQGLSNISFSEDSDKGLPETLNLKPFLNGFGNRGKESNLLEDFVLEGSNVSHNSHLIEGVNVIFNFLLNISNISTNYGGNTVNGINLEFTSIIMGDDFVSELLLKLELLVGVISDIFNLFFDLKKVGVEKLLKDESLLIVGDLDSSKLDDFFPMAVTDRVLSKTLNDGEDFNHIINFVLKVSVGKPLLKLSR